MAIFDRNEWLADQADYENRFENYVRNVVAGWWKCKDGSVVNVEDMETSHIQNCIKMLKTKKTGKIWIERFEKELERRENFKRDLRRYLEEIQEEDGKELDSIFDSMDWSDWDEI